MLAATFPFVVSEALLAEYRTVLVRPALRKLHGLTVAEVEALLTDIAQDAIVPVPMAVPVAPAAQPAPDPGIKGSGICSRPGPTCCSRRATRPCWPTAACNRAWSRRCPSSRQGESVPSA